jgi:hypothetical protein
VSKGEIVFEDAEGNRWVVGISPADDPRVTRRPDAEALDACGLDPLELRKLLVRTLARGLPEDLTRAVRAYLARGERALREEGN